MKALRRTLLPLLMLCMAGCVSNGEVDKIRLSMALLDAYINAATGIADLYLQPDSDGQIHLDEFLKAYESVRLVIEANLAVLPDFYGPYPPANIVSMQHRFTAIEGRIAHAREEVPPLEPLVDTLGILTLP